MELETLPARKNATGSIHSVSNLKKASDADVNETGDVLDHPEPTKRQVRTGRIQFAALCWALFLAGWNDGTTGPLLPRIREIYHVW